MRDAEMNLVFRGKPSTSLVSDVRALPACLAWTGPRGHGHSVEPSLLSARDRHQCDRSGPFFID